MEVATTLAQCPWAKLKEHGCTGKRPSYYFVPIANKQGMNVVCNHCKKRWTVPYNEDALQLWVSGYKASKQLMEAQIERMTVVLPTL